MRSLAQTGNTSPWSDAINVSQSGAGSQPIITAGTDGTLHVIWWDTTEGEQYARTASATAITWTQPISLSTVFGTRKTDPVTGKTDITPPRATRLAATTNGGIHALWIDDKDQLLDIASTGANWAKDSTSLAASASAFDIAADITGTLHLAYVLSANTAGAPAGIYYRVNPGTGWSAPSLVYSSQYFRSAQPNDLRLTVAGGNTRNAIVTWDDPQTGQSRYAVTTDGATSWNQAQIVSDTTTAERASQAQAAFAPNGDWLLIWRQSGTGGCGFLQQRSSDAGQTWSSAEKILSSATRCTEKWTFTYGNDGRLWLVGRPASSKDAATANAVTLAAWDGTAWSQPLDARLTIYDPQTARADTLACIGATVGESGAGIVGCDPGNDIWVARSTLGLKDLITALVPVWKPLEFLSSGTTDDLPALTNDPQGNVFAMWSQQTGSNNTGTALYGAIQTNQRWSRSTHLLQPLANTDGTTIARQPAMAIDSQGKVHVVWSSGPEGPVAYSWAFVRDYSGPAGWTEPIALPATTSASSFPDVTSDPSGSHLFVIYAIPFNEQRGVYVSRSMDGGSTWLTPTLVFDAAAAKWDSIDKPRLTLDQNTNILHATWLRSTLPGSLSAHAIYYARSTDDGQTWSTPQKIAEGDVDWPQIAVAAAHEVHLAWIQTSPQAGSIPHTPYMVLSAHSTDDGEHWSAANAVPGLGQVSGAIGLNGDGAGHLYLAAVSENAGGESTLLVSQWSGQSWDAEPASNLGQPAAPGNAAVLSVAPSLGRLNVLLRLWTFGSGSQGQFAIAATGRNIEPAAASPAPTFTPMPTMTPQATETPSPTATPRPQLSKAEQQPVSNARQGLPPLVLGGVLAALIVIGVSVRWALKARRR